MFYVRELIHDRINHPQFFTDRKNHTNGIENFWNQAKCVLRKYHGIDSQRNILLPAGAET
ncbi:hypothetical protein C7N83_01000 [Neisseria iguanae]|uniref:Transposase n=1 Tax=Neisseria iguanae TaxID=90242 RepID=A0A2P7U320_9NEIS|nr:hypothetical protein C7N83_01000 [Neisseria iguanae]